MQIREMKNVEAMSQGRSRRGNEAKIWFGNVLHTSIYRRKKERTCRHFHTSATAIYWSLVACHEGNLTLFKPYSGTVPW